MQQISAENDCPAGVTTQAQLMLSSFDSVQGIYRTALTNIAIIRCQCSAVVGTKLTVHKTGFTVEV